jgi:hypothetical protein
MEVWDGFEGNEDGQPELSFRDSGAA